MDLDWHKPDTEGLPSIEPLEQQRPQPATGPSDQATPAAIEPTHALPAIYLGHGAPMLLDDQEWVGQLGAWASSMPRPKQILIISAHRGDVDTLFAFREKAPGMPYAHPTVEHFAPLFVTLGAVSEPDKKPDYAIEGYAYGLSKRSFEAQ